MPHPAAVTQENVRKYALESARNQILGAISNMKTAHNAWAPGIHEPGKDRLSEASYYIYSALGIVEDLLAEIKTQ